MTTETQPNEQSADLAVDVLVRRIAQLEARVLKAEQRTVFLESSFKDLIELVRKSENDYMRRTLEAFAGVFHQVSDNLLATANYVPQPDDYHFTEVDANQADDKSIKVVRTGEQFDFYSGHQPDLIQNDNTEVLVAALRRKELLADGETKHFTVTYGSVPPSVPLEETDGLSTTEAG